MKNLIEFIQEALLSAKNRENLKKIAAPAEEYYDDPPVTITQAMSKVAMGNNYWNAQDKMDAWHAGKRKENIKACSVEKLVMFWEICTAKKYDDQLDELELEANRRGFTFKKLKKR